MNIVSRIEIIPNILNNQIAEYVIGLGVSGNFSPGGNNPSSLSIRFKAGLKVRSAHSTIRRANNIESTPITNGKSKNVK